MASRETFVANAFETSLTLPMGATDTTATVNTTTGGPASPCYLVIDPDNDAKREIIYFDGTFTSSTFVTSSTANRHLEGSAAASGLTHDVGAKVVSVPVAQLFVDVNDRVDAQANHVTDTVDAHDASAVSFSPAGAVAATTVQAAIEELDTDKSATTHNHDGTYTKAQAGGQNIWVQATAPTAVATGDLWVDTA